MGDATRSSLPETLDGIAAQVTAIQATLVESLHDELVCAVCGCVFIDPRVLQCQHCFCLRCLYSTVARDRMPQLEVPCAYRCEEMTVTKGDIRTLPKNHYITNTCILLRQHLVRRAQLLEKKFTLLKEDVSQVESRTSAASPVVQFGAAPSDSAAAANDSVADTKHTAERLLQKKERDLVAELYECEWCSCSSSSCEVCPYCWSRVCAECRGQFSDHQFLCVEPNQPGRRPPEGWLPGTAPSGVAALSAETHSSGGGGGGEASLTADAAAHTAEEGGASPLAGHDAAFPFFFTPFFVPTLVKECLVKQHHAPLQLSEIDVRNVTPLRLAVPEYAVQCQHHTTGFAFNYAVHPTFSVGEGVPVDLNTPHWTEGDGKPSSTLSFLANATRLGETVLQDLHKLSTATSDVVMELSSAAHQAYVRRNKGFHMYALHVWVLVRAQCQIARDALLPHLERSRLLENIMGDLVTYRFQQTMGRASPRQKHVIRDRCMVFLKTEIQLCRQLDQVMEGIDAACRGIRALLGRMRDAMRELSQPKVHRGEEHKKSRQSRLRFSVQLFHTRDEQQQQQQQPSTHTGRPQEDELVAADGDVPTRVKQVRGVAARRNAAHATPPSVAAADPGLSDAAVPGSSFRGQIREHQPTTQALTDSLLSLLRCFMQARVWEWSLGNTCIRECGLGEEDRRVLLQCEETLQLQTDSLLRGIWRSARLVYILEVQQDELGPASSLDILMDKETLALLDTATDNPIYEHNEVFEGLKALSQLRNHLLNVSSANIIAARTPDTQQELLNMMTSVLKTTMQHQMTVLRSVTAAEDSYESRFATYLRTRQMTPDVGEAPPINEGTLLAVDVLKALQQHRDVNLGGRTTAPATPPDTAAGAGGGVGQEGVPRLAMARPSRPYPVAPGQKDAKEFSTSSTPLCPYDTRTVTHALLTDFSRRDTALLSCQRFGEALVRAANGQSLDEGRSLFNTDAAEAPTGLHQLPPLPTPPLDGAPPTAAEETSPSLELLPPPLFHVEEELPLLSAHSECPASASEETGSAPRTQVTTLRAREDDSTGALMHETEAATGPADADAPHPLLSTTPPSFVPLPPPSASLRTVDVDAPVSPSRTLGDVSSPVVNTAQEAAADAGHAVAPPNAVHDELLFEADCEDTAVETAPVIPTLADSDGSRKAAKLFKSTFQLPATTTSVQQRRVTYLPFYRGECTYKGMTTTFFVDAQTGAVAVNPQLLAAGGRRQYLLELVSSPLFFILFNSTLSILLHKRYQLEIFYK